MSLHRYWRMNVTNTGSGVNGVNINILEMRTTPGGTNLALTGNGTASASSTDGTDPASNAFDGVNTTRWISANSLPQWIQWDFGVPVDITEVKLISDASGSTAYNPITGTVQFSDDGVTFVGCASFTNISSAAGVTTTLTVIDPIHGNSAMTLPSEQAVGYGGGRAAMTLPSAVIAFYGGANAAIAMPSLQLAITTGAISSISLPSLSATATAHDSTGEMAFTGSIPSLTLSANGGANSAMALPALTLSITGTATSLGEADLTLPAALVTAGGTVSALADAALTLPSPYQMVGYSGALCSVTIGAATVQASGTSGATGSAAITLPLFVLDAEATAQNHGGAQLLIPSVQMGATAQAWLMVPGLSLTAIGSAVVTATYEAYALNLKHKPKPGEVPVDELTHYTNFPFDRIVRYRNSYFGMASGALYLLEGTTDYNPAAPATPTAIPWAWQTGITDFGSPFKKTVLSAYFAGRLSPGATLSIYPGEKPAFPYSYTTPRGTTAQNHRQTFGRGIKERYYAFGGAGAGELALDSIEFNIATLARRI